MYMQKQHIRGATMRTDFAHVEPCDKVALLVIHKVSVYIQLLG